MDHLWPRAVCWEQNLFLRFANVSLKKSCRSSNKEKKKNKNKLQSPHQHKRSFGILLQFFFFYFKCSFQPNMNLIENISGGIKLKQAVRSEKFA